MIETGLTDQVLDDPARALHATARLSRSCRHERAPMTAMIDTQQRRKRPSPCICRAASSCPWCAASRFSCRAGRMRGAVRPVGRRKILDPEDDLRHLSLRRRAASSSATRDTLIDLASAEPRQILSVRRDTHRLCQPVPARGAAGRDHRRRRRAADRERARRGRGARAGRRSCCAVSTFPSGSGRCRRRRFSGGEQQRVNIARGFISDLPILLLDEPTASLDAANRAVVVDLIDEKKRAAWPWSPSSMTTRSVI